MASKPKTRRLRPALLIVIVLLLALIPCVSCLISHVGGAFDHAPAEMHDGLTPGAKLLILQAVKDVDPGRLFDYHTHLVGLGTGGTGAFVNPRMRSWAHPVHRIKFSVYASAAGITDFDQADQQYAARLADLVRHIPRHGRHLILAFDKHYSAAGEQVLEETEFYTPSRYVARLADEHPGLFVAAASVHPYRKDALAALERWAGRGIRMVKWLPNAMGIDPADPRCDPFYRKLKALDMILVSHTGEEKAVEAEEAQRLGNPLRLRRPLEAGVKVLASHCASLGEDEDLESKGRERRPSFDLFLRLMGDKRYEGLLYGEISAMTQFNRLPRPLVTLLERKDLHHRLVNGSDYPLPAINIIVRTRNLVRHGLITEDERYLLNEIYDYNPLLFDFVVKRTLRHPKTKQGFPPAVFMIPPGLEPTRAVR